MLDQDEALLRETTVREAFAAQAGWCLQLGSPFTARLCEAFAERLNRGSAIGRRLLDWPGAPDARHDSVPLRIAGALHALVRSGRAPRLARLYPPSPLPDVLDLWEAVAETLVAWECELDRWLDGPPQTNEVARSAVLMAGCLAITERTGLPLALLELGCSAGLNLLLDRYSYRLGTRAIGPAGSPVHLSPGWTGPDPPPAAVEVAARRGVDLAPPDVRLAPDRDRLVAYLWPDQPDRIARLEGALALALEAPPGIDRDDAAPWLERQLAGRPADGVARVVLHSIAFQYFPEATRGRITAAMEAAGRAAIAAGPLCWLRYEIDPEEGGPTLRLRHWPGGEDRLLARADAHARAVTWLG